MPPNTHSCSEKFTSRRAPTAANGREGSPAGEVDRSDGRPSHRRIGEDVGVFGVEELTIGRKPTELQRDLLSAPLLFKIGFVQSGPRKSFDTAHPPNQARVLHRC